MRCGLADIGAKTKNAIDCTWKSEDLVVDFSLTKQFLAYATQAKNYIQTEFALRFWGFYLISKHDFTQLELKMEPSFCNSWNTRIRRIRYVITYILEATSSFMVRLNIWIWWRFIDIGTWILWFCVGLIDNTQIGIWLSFIFLHLFVQRKHDSYDMQIKHWNTKLKTHN